MEAYDEKIRSRKQAVIGDTKLYLYADCFDACADAVYCGGNSDRVNDRLANVRVKHRVNFGIAMIRCSSSSQGWRTTRE